MGEPMCLRDGGEEQAKGGPGVRRQGDMNMDFAQKH